MKNVFIKKTSIAVVFAMAAITTAAIAFPPPQPHPTRIEVNNAATGNVFWKGSGSYYQSCHNPIQIGTCGINDQGNTGSVTFMNGANPGNYCVVTYQGGFVTKAVNYGQEMSCQTAGNKVHIQIVQ